MMAEDHSEIRSEINVTPLVDVCLVLLIVFMVMTPILTQGPAIDLPKTADPRKITPAPNQFPILVVFDRPPQILFGPEFRWIRRDRLPAEAAALYAMDPQRPITLRADRRLTYGDVKEVMRTLRDAGFQSVGLIAYKENAQPASIEPSNDRRGECRSPACLPTSELGRAAYSLRRSISRERTGA